MYSKQERRVCGGGKELRMWVCKTLPSIKGPIPSHLGYLSYYGNRKPGLCWIDMTS